MDEKEAEARPLMGTIFLVCSKSYHVRYHIKGLNIRSILRLESSFDLILVKSYVQFYNGDRLSQLPVLIKLALWFFSSVHINYAKWVPVHIQDMVNLGNSHPQIAVEFNNGTFTVHMTRRAFLIYGH